VHDLRNGVAALENQILPFILDLLLGIEVSHIEKTVAMAILAVRFFYLFMSTDTILDRRNRSRLYPAWMLIQFWFD
jgi:hypothetical protein